MGACWVTQEPSTDRLYATVTQHLTIHVLDIIVLNIATDMPAINEWQTE